MYAFFFGFVKNEDYTYDVKPTKKGNILPLSSYTYDAFSDLNTDYDYFCGNMNKLALQNGYFSVSAASSSVFWKHTTTELETGFDYFGARFPIAIGSSDLSVWLSVDPLASKYPSMSPYMYTAGNPVMLVDPDGMRIIGSRENKKAFKNRMKAEGRWKEIRKKYRRRKNDLVISPNERSEESMGTAEIKSTQYGSSKDRNKNRDWFVFNPDINTNEYDNIYDIARADYSDVITGTINRESNGKLMDYQYTQSQWIFSINANIPSNPFNNGLGVSKSTFTLIDSDGRSSFSSNDFVNSEGMSIPVTVTFSLGDVRNNVAHNWPSNGGLNRSMIHTVPWSYRAVSNQAKVKVPKNWLGIRNWSKATIVESNTTLTTDKIHHF